jgi:hypothetical protein
LRKNTRIRTNNKQNGNNKPELAYEDEAYVMYVTSRRLSGAAMKRMLSITGTKPRIVHATSSAREYSHSLLLLLIGWLTDTLSVSCHPFVRSLIFPPFPTKLPDVTGRDRVLGFCVLPNELQLDSSSSSCLLNLDRSVVARDFACSGVKSHILVWERKETWFLWFDGDWRKRWVWTFVWLRRKQLLLLDDDDDVTSSVRVFKSSWLSRFSKDLQEGVVVLFDKNLDDWSSLWVIEWEKRKESLEILESCCCFLMMM